MRQCQNKTVTLKNNNKSIDFSESSVENINFNFINKKKEDQNENIRETLKNNWGLMDYEIDEVQKNNYEPYQFEEEELEEDDYYYEDNN